MKNISLFIFLICVILLSGCDYHNTNNQISLPDYLDKECHWGEGFQDYTHYCKYFYDEESVKKFETHGKFEQVTRSDIENISSYFEDFDGRAIGADFYDKYDFDYQSQIKEGDYFCIVTKEGKKAGDGVYGKFDSYDIYYVDMSECILYFIHHNL